MRKLFKGLYPVYAGLILFAYIGCKDKSQAPANDSINALNLKRGGLISCGTADQQFGTVGFETSCSEKVKKDFDLAMALLHSFEYDEAEKIFAKVIDEEPGCAMAYWGVAMSNYHQLWSPPTQPELEKGAKAIEIAQSLSKKSKRESAYIDALAAFYKDWNNADHKTRYGNFEKAMGQVYKDYPDDKEAAIFYSLALTGAADPTDKTYSKQKKAGEILNTFASKNPNHPGLIHYIIHAYDSPELAPLALVAARKYASIAPSSSHAQHMPSHIFTRLGLWDEDILSNLASASSAKCYAENTGIKGHWDEELHAIDYLVYAYLQKGDNTMAKQQWEYLRSMETVTPTNFKVAYAFAAIPARYVLENRMWKEATSLELYPADLNWDEYPWQKAIHHFARLLGAVNTGNLDLAHTELSNLNASHNKLIQLKDPYKAGQVQIQIKTSEAWMLFKEGKHNEALELMTMAADMEDNTQKHPVTPGEVLPARELLADMLLQMNKPDKALQAYEADLKEHSNRFNGLYGAALAAERSGNTAKATSYYQQLVTIGNAKSPARPELESAKSFLKTKSTAQTGSY